MKKHIVISILAILFFSFLLSQNYLAKTAMARGAYYFNNGAYDLVKAEQAYKIAVFLKPKILWGHYQLARIYFVKGEKEMALAEINKELEANPQNQRSYYVRGLIYGYWPDLARAEEDFRRFTLWAPSEWAGYNDLAWILAKEGKYAEVEADIQNAMTKVQNANQNPWLLNSLGVAELNLKKYKEAVKTFKIVQKLAENLSLKEWQRAYPGNNPAESAKGFEAFKRAIEANLMTAVDKGGI